MTAVTPYLRLAFGLFLSLIYIGRRVQTTAFSTSLMRSAPLLHRPKHSFRYDTKSKLKNRDTEIFDLIQKEQGRQRNGLCLIASENFVSDQVKQVLGSALTNKYSEGLPAKRYYGGNQYIDEIEELCQQRALELFRLDPAEWGVNVQPYSGSIANFAVYTALLQPGDKLMGLSLVHGGHLSHGFESAKGGKISASSIYFNASSYSTDASTGLLNYTEIYENVKKVQPKLLICGASAYPRDWDYKAFDDMATSCGAYLMADISHISGLVAIQASNSPFEYCDVVTTTTHKSLRGPRAAMIFYRRASRRCIGIVEGSGSISGQHSIDSSRNSGDGSSGESAVDRASSSSSSWSSSSSSSSSVTHDLRDKINKAVFPGLQGGPHNHHIAAIAVALKEAASPAFISYIHQVKKNAIVLAKALSEQGCIIVTGGTENHLILWNASNTCLSGSLIETVLEQCGLYVNKNMLPGDVSAMHPTGVRLGVLAATTIGMREEHMRSVAMLISRATNLAKEMSDHHHHHSSSGQASFKVKKTITKAEMLLLMLNSALPFKVTMEEIKRDVEDLVVRSSGEYYSKIQ